MTSIFEKLLRELEKGRSLVLATIIREAGSTPRGTGSQMLVGSQGRILGTIGGGAVEYCAEQLSRELLERQASFCRDFQLHSSGDTGMVCGGDVTVWMQYIDGNDTQWAGVAGRLLEQVHAGKKGWLVQQLDGSAPSLLDETGTVIAGAALASAAGLTAADGMLTDSCFSMPLPVGERVIIFGGGHCAQALAPLLHSVGFRVTVMDQRPEFADKTLFPQAEAVICGSYQHICDYLSLTAEDYLVVMTNGHSHDFEVQAQVLRQPLTYIGVIGSRKKKAAVNAMLREAGIGEEAIASVHTPIGTAIKAVTPQEIAVSIAGEMIFVRALRREQAGLVSHGCPMHNG